MKYQPRLSRTDFYRLFSPDQRDRNEVECPRCSVHWIAKRGSDGENIYLLRAAGSAPDYAGIWSFYESAPRGEGDSHTITLTLQKQGSSYTGLIEEANWNDYSREETMKKNVWPVTAHREGEILVVAITDGELSFGYQGHSSNFAVKAFRIWNEISEKEEDQLFVAAHFSFLATNTPFRVWQRQQ